MSNINSNEGFEIFISVEKLKMMLPSAPLWVPANSTLKLTIVPNRYPMCKDQPAQIDCRNTSCVFHSNGSCQNVSPAITLNQDKTFVCWSKKEKA